MWKQLVAFALLLCAVVVLARQDHRVTDLPGIPDGVNFDQYAGYLTVDESRGRELFYWLVESKSEPSIDPLVLWFNGGPGCSSLGGFLAELGPFWPNEDGKSLQHNHYAWNKVANVIFIDSPAFVGFSTSKDKRDLVTGDAKTARDAYTFLQQFYVNYPQYKGRDTYISGESYAGHYVPNLAKVILDENKLGIQPHINFKGFFLGNPWINPSIDNLGSAVTWWSHNLISDGTYNSLLKHCNFSAFLPGPNQVLSDKDVNADACDGYLTKAYDEMGNINIYDIYSDVCLTPHHKQFLRQMASSQATLTAFAKQVLAANDMDPCVDDETAIYLNLPAVKKALHVYDSIEWTDCSSELKYSNDDYLGNMIPVIEELLSSGIRMLIFSGDVDSVCPTVGTRAWLKTILADAPVTREWHKWEVEGQLAGYVVEYAHNLTFATVRGAGHMVPYTQPQRGFELFKRFLAGESA